MTDSNESNVFSIDSHLGQYAQMRTLAQARLRTNKDRIFSELKGLGATRVEIRYSGSGDSGGIDSVEVFRGEEQIRELGTLSVVSTESHWDDSKKEWVSKTGPAPMPTAKTLEEFVYDWLEMEHPGWENNDGADGTCSIDLSQGSFSLEHTNYYTESDTTESTL